MTEFINFVLYLTLMGVMLVCTVGAWIQHVITCILNEQWILLAFGIVVPPVGWIHGLGIWFGIF